MRQTHEYTAYVPGILLYLRYIYIYVYVSELVTTELFLSPPIGTDTGYAGLVLAGCRWVEKTVLNTHRKQRRGTCG